MANRRLDPESEAALEMVEMEKKREHAAMLERENKTRMMARAHEMAGQIRATKMFQQFSNVSSLVWLKQVKETGIYKEMPGISTWESFCNYIGLSRANVDKKLDDLKILGEEFLLTVSSLSVSYRDIRKLKQLTSDGTVEITGTSVIIGDESIPLDPDHGEDLQAAIEKVIEEKEKALSEARATIRAKEKVMEAKEKVIQKQEKEIEKLEGSAKKAGYTPAEEKIMRDMDNARTSIDGFFMQFDPERNPLPEDATARMKAKLMHTLDYFRRVAIAAFDTAGELYGEPEIDDDWVPPHLREPLKLIQTGAESTPD